MIIKSENDNREYKRLVLDNKMEVVLIYDKDTDLSAASLSVAVGSYMDPKNALGLAHFLEHMLFMGTKKYPDTKYFMEYINKNGGLFNAHTANEYTTYFYNIYNTNFVKSLDIFGQFFIHPLFDKGNVDKEMNAVNSEHSKNIVNDGWRLSRLLSHLSKKEHPFNKFGTGTLETLGHDNIREMLIEFFEKYYSSNVMKLVVLSNKPFDEMEKVVNKIFGQVKNKNYIPDKIKITPFAEPDKEVEISTNLVKLVPIIDEDNLFIFWDLPPTLSMTLHRLWSKRTS